MKGISITLKKKKKNLIGSTVVATILHCRKDPHIWNTYLFLPDPPKDSRI